MTKSGNIPQPSGLPILGNLLDIDMEFPLKSLFDLAEKHGERDGAQWK
jgi:cytochrome P450 / NADPH-cytochrome P450 reductase